MCSKYTVLKVTHVKNNKQSNVPLLYKQNIVKRKQRIYSKSFAIHVLLIMYKIKSFMYFIPQISRKWNTMMLLANNGTMILLQRHKPRHYLYLERFLVSCPKFLISVLQGCFSAISVLM